MFSRVLVSDWRAWISPAVHPASRLAPHRRRPERVRARQCSQMVGDGNIVGKWNANQPKMAYLTRKGSRLESCKGATMEDANVWEVDRIAASELLSLLKQTSEEDWGRVIAKAFSKSRFQNYQWAARRVHDSAIRVLELEAKEEFQRREAVWADGYRHAEECLMSQTPSDLLETVVPPPKSQGQLLRAMLRSARQQSVAKPRTS